MTDVTPSIPQQTFATEAESRLVVAFFVMLKTARLIEPDNATYMRKLDELTERLHALQKEDGDIALKIHHDYFFLKDKVVRLSDDVLSGFLPLLEDWNRWRLGGIRLLEGISREEINSLVLEMARSRPASDGYEDIGRQLTASGLSKVELLGQAEEELSDEPLSPEEVLRARRQKLRRTARAAFFKSLDAVKSVMQQTTEDEDIDIARTRRVVRSLVDQIMLDESSLLELTALRDYDDYTYAHSTNVSVYALTIGARLGMDRSRLAQLGFGALFHDIGKVQLPKDLIHKPEAFDENDWIQMQQHPLVGAKTILRNLDLNLQTARAARIAFEHHINTDLTGYPQLRYKRRKPSLFSMIVTIADAFDAMTSGRVYVKQTLMPDEVIKKMRHQMTMKFDPLLLRIFNDILGVYPAGSLVLLSTNQLALVLTHNEHDRTRPYVKIVGDKDGLYEHSQWADLSAAEYVSVDIVKLVEPEKYGLSASRFILQD